MKIKQNLSDEQILKLFIDNEDIIKKMAKVNQVIYQIDGKDYVKKP